MKDGIPTPIPTPNAIWSKRLKPPLGAPMVAGDIEADEEVVSVVDEDVRVFVAVTVQVSPLSEEVLLQYTSTVPHE
jgi:hypothetical protein